MAFLIRALSGHNEKSRQRYSDIKIAAKELQSNRATIVNLVKEKHEVKVAVERVFDTSLPSAQAFLKAPARLSLLSNEDTILKLFSALSDQDMPVAALISDLSRQHGLDSISDIVVKYLELLSPLIASKHLPEEGYNLFDAIEDGWHGDNLFRNGSFLKANISQPVSPLRSKYSDDLEFESSPKVVQFVSHLLNRRSPIQQEPVSFQESDAKKSSSANRQTYQFIDDLKENFYLSKTHPHSNEHAPLTDSAEKGLRIKTDSHQRRPLNPKALFSNASISKEKDAKEQHFASANSHDDKGDISTFQSPSSKQETCDSSSIPDVAVSVPSNASFRVEKASSVECLVEKSINTVLQEGISENSIEVSSNVISDGIKQMAADRESTASPYKSPCIMEEVSAKKEETPANFVKGSVSARFRRISYTGSEGYSFSHAERENMAHFRKISYTGSEGYSFSHVERENMAHLRKISYTGSQGHSFSMYTTDSEDESLSVSTEVSLLVAASESQQPDVDLEGVSIGWATSDDYPNVGIAEGSVSSESNYNADDCQETDFEPYSEGAGAGYNISTREVFPYEGYEHVDTRTSESTGQLEADLEVIHGVTSVSTSCPSCKTATQGDSDALEMPFQNDPETTGNMEEFSSAYFVISSRTSNSSLLKENLPGQCASCIQPIPSNHMKTIERDLIQHDAELTEKMDVYCQIGDSNYLKNKSETEYDRTDLHSSVPKCIHPSPTQADMFADEKERYPYSEINMAKASAQSNFNPYDSEYSASGNCTKMSDLHGDLQDGKSTLVNHNDIAQSKLYPDIGNLNLNVTVAHNDPPDAPANKDEVAVASLFNDTKEDPCESIQKHGIENLLLSNTWEEKGVLDKHEVFDTIQQEVFNQRILDETSEVVDGQDNYIIPPEASKCVLQLFRSADQNDHFCERLLRDVPPGATHLNEFESSSEEQKHIIGDSRIIVSASFKDELSIPDEIGQVTDLLKQEPIKEFVQIEQIGCVDDILDKDIVNCCVVKSTFLENVAQPDMEHDIVYDSASMLRDSDGRKTSDKFRDTLNTDIDLWNCQACTENAKHKVHDHNKEAPTGKGHHTVTTNVLAVEQWTSLDSSQSPIISTNDKVSLVVPTTADLKPEPQNLSDNACSHHKSIEIADVPFSEPAMHSCTMPQYAVRSYIKKKSTRSAALPFGCRNSSGWNASRAGVTRTYRRYLNHKRQWLVCCFCCRQPATHL